MSIYTTLGGVAGNAIGGPIGGAIGKGIGGVAGGGNPTSTALSTIGTVAGSFFGGPVGAFVGGQIGSLVGGVFGAPNGPPVPMTPGQWNTMRGVQSKLDILYPGGVPEAVDAPGLSGQWGNRISEMNKAASTNNAAAWAKATSGTPLSNYSVSQGNNWKYGAAQPNAVVPKYNGNTAMQNTRVSPMPYRYNQIIPAQTLARQMDQAARGQTGWNRFGVWQGPGGPIKTNQTNIYNRLANIALLGRLMPKR